MIFNKSDRIIFIRPFKKIISCFVFVTFIFTCSKIFSAILFTSDEGKERHIYSIEPGKKPVKLTQKDEKSLRVVYNMFPVSSADGKRIAYASYRIYEDEGLKEWKQWNGKPLYKCEEHYLFLYAYFPTRTYFTRHKSLNWNIYQFDMKTKKERKISNFLWDETEPQFMSRSSDILYILKAQKSTFVLRGSKSGKSFKQITLADNQAEHPQISPDSRTLLYQSYRDGNWNIYKMTMNDLPSKRFETRLTWTSNISELFPKWSPDGKYIFYLANRPGVGIYDLYRINEDGSGKKKLTEREQVAPDYRVSPDGSKIAYIATNAGGGKINILDTKSGKKSSILTTGRSANFPVWSPDGKSITYLSEDEKGKLFLYITGFDGKGMKKISEMKCSPSPPIWN